jgi:hypothetical protein
VEVGRRRPGAASTGAAVTGVAARAGSSAFIRKAVYGRTEQEARAKLIEALAARQAGGLPGRHAERTLGHYWMHRSRLASPPMAVNPHGRETMTASASERVTIQPRPPTAA